MRYFALKAGKKHTKVAILSTLDGTYRSGLHLHFGLHPWFLWFWTTEHKKALPEGRAFYNQYLLVGY
jgi:hypothetical protein